MLTSFDPYSFCFWISLIIVLLLSIIALFYGKSELIKDFALPTAASIFAFGQLWQQEKQNEFEQIKYFKEHYFELMGILNSAYTFEADLSNKDFPAKFVDQCTDQMQQLVLLKEKSLVLFANNSTELENMIATLQKHMCALMSIALELRRKFDQNKHLQFNVIFAKFAEDAEKLSIFLRGCYNNKMNK